MANRDHERLVSSIAAVRATGQPGASLAASASVPDQSRAAETAASLSAAGTGTVYLSAGVGLLSRSASFVITGPILATIGTPTDRAAITITAVISALPVCTNRNGAAARSGHSPFAAAGVVLRAAWGLLLKLTRSLDWHSECRSEFSFHQSNASPCPFLEQPCT